MEAAMNNRLLNLGRGDVVELIDAQGTTLRIGRGSVWITQERDRRDVVLGAGDTWTVERDGLTLAEARGDTALLIAAGAHRTRLRRQARGWKERFAAWLDATPSGGGGADSCRASETRCPNAEVF
jgi:hypothetical protein